MKFDITLSDDLDLTEFRRLLSMNEGADQADFDLTIADSIIRVRVSTAFLQYKNPMVLIGLMIGHFPIMPKHHNVFQNISPIKDLWDYNSYWIDMLDTSTSHVVDSVGEIAKAIHRVSKLKAFW